MNVFYYCELGYLNFNVLGSLEKYFIKNPRTKFNILTYEDYFKILDLAFPNRFTKSLSVLKINPREIPEESRKYHDLEHAGFQRDLREKGYSCLSKELGCYTTDWREGRQLIANMSEPLSTGEKSEKKFINMLCRNRKLDSERNLDKLSWLKVIDKIKSVKDFENKRIIFHGLKSEVLEMNIKNSEFCTDIIKSIFYLNHSALFVTSYSGFTQLASNCGSDVMCIGPEYQMIPFNPFGKKNIQVEKDNIKYIDVILEANLKI